MTESKVYDEKLLRKASDRFVAHFGTKPTVAAYAPGRVNLIGDHVDYCNGYVLPVALQFTTLIVARKNGGSSCRIVSITDNGEELETNFTLPVTTTTNVPDWAKYVIGVIHYFPGKVEGFDAVIVSSVPMGSGVSSSAALEVSVFTTLEALAGIQVETTKKALACQKAEHDFAGMPCGIMDQFISTKAMAHHALLIDCKSLEAELYPVVSEDMVIMVTNSNVKHQLTGSEYPERRSQCQKAAEMLGKASLREACLDDLEVLKQMNADPLVIKRAEHVINEIARTKQAAEHLRLCQYKKAGQLFFESHDSLSILMEVSCPELDQLVDISRGVPGVYGSRMTGGGFGGCVVSLVQKDHVEDFKQAILSQYKGNPTFFVCLPSDGARVIKLNK